MRSLKSALIIATALIALDARDASACGGCFHNDDIMQMENTQVTGHRMILSVSKTQSTLWDQIEYMGNPSSFAWVLPIKGKVDVGVSSDALFGNLEEMTKVTINSPTITCPGPPFCGGVGSFSSAGPGGPTGGGSFDAGDGPVTVTAQEVVGPYETVQLSSQDPQALKTWLTSHNYIIPADIDPIIAAYVADGFDFLALKLVPGMGVQSMKPVRVTTPGASPVLPLRMVAAGTGATTSITLWVISEGAYVTANFPSFTIDESQLVWDWDTSSSNYKDLRQQGYTASMGKGWLIEASEPLSQFTLADTLEHLAKYTPTASGYADDMGMGAVAACDADLNALYAGLGGPSTWISRLHAELPHAALDTDLTLMASLNQATLNRSLNASQTKGTPPACPTYPPCDDSGGAYGGYPGYGAGGAGGAGGANGASGSGSHGGCGSGCTIGARTDMSMSLGAGVLAMTAIATLRRRRRATLKSR